MPKLLNWEILREPLNWFTIWAIALILWFLVEAISRHPAAAISVDDNAS